MPNPLESLSPLAKAHQINLDDSRYGTFAEIGAGQEVARYFFLAGRASHTIAKTISAYDMVFSDEIYGRESNGRYVCESRLNKMLNKEYGLLLKRLGDSRGDKSKFFAYANTVTTGSSEVPRCRGWMGVRFQNEPQGEFNEVVLHVRMMDRQRIQQQEALGVLGVNLLYAALYKIKNPTEFILSLVENLKEGQVYIDVLKFRGPSFSDFDNRLVNLELVRRGLSEAILFNSKMELLTISEAVYNKTLLIQRGNYRPITNSHIDLHDEGLKYLQESGPKTQSEAPEKSDAPEILTLNEIAMQPGDPQVSEKDYLNRIEILASLNYNVMVTQFSHYYQLKSFFRRYTQHPLKIVMAASHLKKIFDEEYYKNLEGGILEGLGKLLDSKSRLLIYPYLSKGSSLNLESFTPPKNVKHLYDHFVELGHLKDLPVSSKIKNFCHSEDILKLIQNKDQTWVEHVPPSVSQFVKERKLFGYSD